MLDGMTSARVLSNRPTSPPWAVRIAVLAAAVAVITVFTGGIAAAVRGARKTLPPPAAHPPRVDDPDR